MAEKQAEWAQALQQIDQYIDALETRDGALIKVLHEAQDIIGYLPQEVQNHIAHRLDVPSAKVFGVVTFYSFFNTKPKGTFAISVCMGTACFVRGAEAVLEEFENELGIKVGETTEDAQFTLDSIRCVGACGLAPVVSVNGNVYGRVGPADVKKIVEEHMAKGGDPVE